MYEKVVKRILDVVLSTIALVGLSWLYVVFAVAIVLDDPGPVFFKQKRIGKDRSTFMLYKFRTMKCSAPHDTPTHLLEDPQRYITRVGAVLRKTSLDELPQFWNILSGSMSVIGPRPALWNQQDLIEAREQYGANQVRPGLTGLAQISGRDRLSIKQKAKIDGDYVKALRRGGMTAFRMDLRCFFGTVLSVLRQDGVVEGAKEEEHIGS